MSYIKGTLSKDEKIEVVAKKHWLNYVTTVIFGIAALLSIVAWFATEMVFGIGFVAFFFICLTIWKFLKIKLTEMVVTNKRVVCRSGVISINTEELKNQKIESVEIKQSLFGRIFGYANIWFSGTGTSKVVFTGVAAPWKLKAKFEEIVGD